MVCSTSCSCIQQRKQQNSVLQARRESNPPPNAASNAESVSMAWRHHGLIWDGILSKLNNSPALLLAAAGWRRA